jgi:hypothetical protein
MRTLISSVVLMASVAGLSACSDNSTETTAPVATLQNATSSQSVEAAKQAVLTESRPKADPATPASSYVAIDSGNQLMYRYLGLAGLPLDYRDIATKISTEYSRSNDEFRKNDVLKALQPQIDASIAQAKAQQYLKVDISQPIGKYDFEKNGFPVDSSLWESGSYRYFYDNTAYRLSFTNGESFRYLTNIQEEAARNIERLRSAYDGLHMVVYAFAHSADVTKTTVQAEIVRIELLDRKGNLLASQ